MTLLETACTVPGGKAIRTMLVAAGAAPGVSLHLLVQRKDLAGALQHLPYVARFGSAALQRTDERGNTVLHLAVEASLTPVIKLLVTTHGADVYAHNADGKTPAALAADGGVRAVQVALAAAESEAGADVAMVVPGRGGAASRLVHTNQLPVDAGQGGEQFKIRNPLLRAAAAAAGSTGGAPSSPAASASTRSRAAAPGSESRAEPTPRTRATPRVAAPAGCAHGLRTQGLPFPCGRECRRKLVAKARSWSRERGGR